MGSLHLARSEWKAALETFQGTYRLSYSQHTFSPWLKCRRAGIQALKPTDQYSWVAIGNICLSYALMSKSEKQQRYFKSALESFQRALKADQRNYFAANGVGAILAEQGALDEAGDVFLQVREATTDFPDVWINLANVYVAQKKYVQAVKLYENCMKKFSFSHNVDLLTLLSRAHYKHGNFKESRHVLTKALHLSPQNLDLQFNLALAHQQWCLSLLRSGAVEPADIVTAKREIKHSIRIFTVLASTKQQSKYLHTPKRAAEEFRLSRDLYKKACFRRVAWYLCLPCALVGESFRAIEKKKEQQKAQQEEEESTLPTPKKLSGHLVRESLGGERTFAWPRVPCLAISILHAVNSDAEETEEQRRTRKSPPGKRQRREHRPKLEKYKSKDEVTNSDAELESDNEALREDKTEDEG
ncbi:hypothetical protein Zmor_012319 [Zophobas morio]|uniref:Uncharacterized protein n=1 Tax=Zophobas morio TaxID=2755281 RepID=A0AA38LZ82_9CUCU|nr:hypothetical protein Zmor_012319 [Zophobas morio]